MRDSVADLCRRSRACQQTWALTPVASRLRLVRKLRNLLARDAESLCLAVTQDVERPAAEVMASDVMPSADALKFLEKHASRILRPRSLPMSQRPVWLFGGRESIRRAPWGVVGNIGTWNYPIFLNLVPMAQAIVAGNSVLWKPSELSATLSPKLVALFREAGFPEDLLLTLPATREAGPELLEADIDHLLFTGSEAAGKRIAGRLAERLIPCTLELSGCDAMIVHADADIDLAARAAWTANTLNRGQTCVAVRRIMVERPAYAAMVEALRKHAPAVRAEPLVMWPQAQQAERLISEAIQLGARPLGGEAPTAQNDPPRFAPSMVIDATPEMAICKEASFSPVSAVMPFDDFNDGYFKWNASYFQLSASIFTSSPKNIEAWASRLTVTTIVVNDVIMPTAHPSVAFGGRKSAGWGVTRGEEGLLALTTPQAILTRKGKFRPHYDGTGSAGTSQLIAGMVQWKHSATFGERCRGFLKMLGGVWKSR